MSQWLYLAVVLGALLTLAFAPVVLSPLYFTRKPKSLKR